MVSAGLRQVGTLLTTYRYLPDFSGGISPTSRTFSVTPSPSRALAPLQAAVLASKLMQQLRLQYWDMDFVGPTENVEAMPAEFAPQLARCVGWAVQWQQDVYLGETEWPWENEPPGSLVFAFDPDSGPGNEGHYREPEALA